MDDHAYQFYLFHYHEFKKDFNIKKRLEYEEIVQKCQNILPYIRIYENFITDEHLAKFKVFYACKYLIMLNFAIYVLYFVFYKDDKKNESMNSKNFIKKAKKLLKLVKYFFPLHIQ